MLGTRQTIHGAARQLLLIALSFLLFSACKVYTVKKSDLEEKLKSKNAGKYFKGLNLNAISSIHSGKMYSNNIDTLKCVDETGKTRTKRFRYDSKITIVTTNNKAIKFYAKTLYIWKDEYLIGERTIPTLYGPNFYPVRMSDISRIEVK